MKRPRKLVLRTSDPCPCGSGRSIEACHFDPTDGKLRKPVRPLRPAGPLTGFSHPRCYLKGTKDCSEQISREHYISSSVLTQMGEALKVDGLHWLDAGKTLEASVGNLTAKILCRRHNEMLSPLDTEAALFFSALKEALSDLNRKTLSRRPIFHLVSGELLQSWMLKVACGHYFGIGSSKGKKLTDQYGIGMEKVHQALLGNTWAPRCGLYLRASVGKVVMTGRGIKVGALLDEQRMEVVGVTVGLLGLEMDLLFDAANTNPGPWTSLAQQPTEIVWKRKTREHHIVLTWPVGHQERSITLQRG